MAKPKTKDHQFAQAMKMLRMRSGKSLAELESTVGVKRQSMSRWENATATFPEEKIALYLKAVNGTQEDLEREMGMLSEPDHFADLNVPAFKPQAFPVRGFGNYEGFMVQDETMFPFVGAGEFVLFERGRPPRRGEACLVERRDHSLVVRNYEKEENGYVFFRTLNPDATEQYPYSEVIGRHRVAFRGG